MTVSVNPKSPRATQDQLWLKPSAEAKATPLPGTDGALNVTYSPNGWHIAFASGTEIKRRPIGDGSTGTLARGGSRGQIGLAWLDDGTILYEGAGSAILRIPKRGGTAD